MDFIISIFFGPADSGIEDVEVETVDGDHGGGGSASCIVA